MGNKEQNIAVEILGTVGNMMSGSKSIYLYDNPRNVAFFNITISTVSGQIWYGDLDLTLSFEKLRDLSGRLQETLYVSHAPATYGTHNVLVQSSVFSVNPIGDIIFGAQHRDGFFYLDRDGIPRRQTEEEYLILHPAQEPEPVAYSEHDFIETDLPDLKKIRVRKGTSYSGRFQEWFLQQYGKKKAVEIYTDLWVCPEYDSELMSRIRKTYERTYPGIHPVKLDQSVVVESWETPAVFRTTWPWMNPKKGYIKIKGKG